VTHNPQTTPIATFWVAFHIFVVGEHRHFEFGVQAIIGTSQPIDNKLSLKGAWSRHMTHFKYFVPLKYLCKGLC